MNNKSIIYLLFNWNIFNFNRAKENYKLAKQDLNGQLNWMLDLLMNNKNNVNGVQMDENLEYEIISSNERCIKCRFQCKTILEDINQINISCKHPKGPGSPVHCIYFKPS